MHWWAGPAAQTGGSCVHMRWAAGSPEDRRRQPHSGGTPAWIRGTLHLADMAAGAAMCHSPQRRSPTGVRALSSISMAGPFAAFAFAVFAANNHFKRDPFGDLFATVFSWHIGSDGLTWPTCPRAGGVHDGALVLKTSVVGAEIQNSVRVYAGVPFCVRVQKEYRVKKLRVVEISVVNYSVGSSADTCLHAQWPMAVLCLRFRGSLVLPSPLTSVALVPIDQTFSNRQGMNGWLGLAWHLNVQGVRKR